MSEEGGGWGRAAGGRAPEVDPVRGPFRQRRIDHFQVLAPLGEGGMGTVYLAFDTKLQREVALKVLLPGPYLSEDALTRFVDEARITALVSEHPNLVSIYNAARSQEGEVYLAMEMIRGGTTLESWIREGKTLSDPAPAAELLAQVCEGLQYVHDKGVVHRDLKPANILIASDGRAVLGDFGVAKTEGQRGSHTLTGTFMGTLAYGSPEQATDSKTVTFKSDVYGIGAVLYAVLTGRPPHQGPNAVSILLSIMEQDPVPPRELNPHAPAALEAVCLKALARDPDQRYGSARELAEALRAAAAAPAAASAQTTRARRPGASPSRTGRVAPSRRAKAQAPRSNPVPLLVGVGALAALGLGVALTGKTRSPAVETAASPTGSARPTPRATATTSPTASPQATASPTASSAATPTPSPAPSASSATPPPSPAATPTTTPSPQPTPTGDTTPPAITIQAPTREVVHERRVLVRLVFDEPVVRLIVNKVDVRLRSPIRSWRRRVVLAPDNQNLDVVAEDAAGNVARERVPLRVDLPPRLAVRVERPDPKRSKVIVRGQVLDEGKVTLRFGKARPKLGPQNEVAIQTTVGRLRRGRLLSATDAGGQTAQVRLTSRLRLLRDWKRWVAADLIDQQGELLWVGALLPSDTLRLVGPVMLARPDDPSRTFPIGQVLHLPTRLPLLVIPGGAGVVGLEPRALDAELAFARKYPSLGKFDDATIRKALADETPRRRVTVPPFLLGRYEVREREWDRVQVERGRAPRGSRGPTYPRGDVTWETAQAWVEAAGGDLRLPSQTEWEYACRAGTTTRFYWGDGPVPGHCVGGAKHDDAALPRAVDAPPRRANPFGLLDMHGNCWEWCADDYVPGHERRKQPHLPIVGTPRAAKRVTRGGACRHPLPLMRASYRFGAAPDFATPVHGFRVARSLPLD